jgi:hypothetical protein
MADVAIPSPSTSGPENAPASRLDPKLPANLMRVYEAYRTSLMNMKYYGWKLKVAKRINTSVELLIALAAASSVSGWTIWSTVTGGAIWSVIGAIAAVLAAAKPFFPLTDNISNYSKLWAEHNSNYLSLKDLVQRISIHQIYSPTMEQEFEQYAKRHRELAVHDDPNPSKRLIERFFAEVNLQIPPESLWCPNQ